MDAGFVRRDSMKDCLASIKPAVRQLHAYTLKHFEARVKVNQNENPFDMPETVKAAVQEAMAGKAWISARVSGNAP